MYVVWSWKHKAYYRNIGGIPYCHPSEMYKKFWTEDLQEVRPFKSILGARSALRSYMWSELHPSGWKDENFDKIFRITTVKLELGEVV